MFPVYPGLLKYRHLTCTLLHFYSTSLTHCCNTTTTATNAVILCFTAFPDMHLELATTNYIGEPLPSSLPQPAIEAAINIVTYPCRSPRLTYDSMDVFYGVGVLEFINNHALRLQLCTGSEADNMRVSHFWDRCTLM